MPTEKPLLSPRQLEILKIIADFQTKNCYLPTLSEMADRLGLSRSTVYEHLSALRQKKLLTALPGKARSLKLTARSRKLLKQLDSEKLAHKEKNRRSDSVEIPLLGRVAAGAAIEAIEDERGLSICAGFEGPNIFALEVVGDSMIEDVGDSMIEEGIFDGDYVICRNARTAENGSLVVAVLADNEVTLKHLYKEKNHIRLQPANSNYQPIITGNCTINAVAVGLVRKF